MLDHLPFFLVCIFVPAGVVLTVYLKAGKGLALRIFGSVVPVMGLISMLAYVVGLTRGNLVVIAASTPVAVIACVWCLWWLHRIVVKRISSQATSLAASIAQLSATAQQTASTSSEQAATVTQVTATVEELNQMSAGAAERAKGVLKLGVEAIEQGGQGLKAIARAVNVMELIGQVGDVVEMVGDLADQSNLLAVNASIEAAKAGDHGRGFAVVASEVRNLAEQSKEAAGQIREAIRRTDEGRDAVGTAETVINELAAVLEQASDRAREISGATVQQSAGIKQINEAMLNVSQGGKDTAFAAGQLQEAVVSLEQISDDLAAFVTG